MCSACCSPDGVAALVFDDLRWRWDSASRLGSRRSVSVTHERMGLGSSFKAPKRPSSSALLLGWLLLFIPPASSVVCPSCKDTIPGCKGGADCPLLKTPMENAASLAGTSTSKSPDLTQLLPPELLCTFTKSVMETLCAVARAPKGGGSVDISPTSISSPLRLSRLLSMDFALGKRRASNWLADWRQRPMRLP